MPHPDGPPHRRGKSPEKRDAILDAARDAFSGADYGETSVDVIAARAGVSKRTVYDHFGGKEALFGAVLTRETTTLVAALRSAIDEELPEGCDPASSLLPFARRVATVAFHSSEYASFRRLVAPRGAPGGAPTPTLPDDADPEEHLVARMARFARDGALDAPDARRAAQHFVALTFTMAFETLSTPREAEIDALLIDGVAAFLRAYAPRG
jgi:TetR/AcrR family transcriptional repressor of mexJK operon